MTNAAARNAKIGERFTHIVDADGLEVHWGDPRVVHIWPVDWNSFMTQLVANMFARRGWRYRIGGPPSVESLQCAKELCSGRECLSFTSIVGGTLLDLQANEANDDITVYYGVLEEGPCQNGAWTDIWGLFARKLGLRNAVFPGHPTYRNNYVGQGLRFGLEFMAITMVADVLSEAENTLRCIACDQESAMREFRSSVDDILIKPRHGMVGLLRNLKRWARRVSTIPREPLAEAPRILCLGGGAVAIAGRSLSNFVAEQGAVIKIQDIADFEFYLESEAAMRCAFESGVDKSEYFGVAQTALRGIGVADGWRSYLAIMRSLLTLHGGNAMRWLVRRLAAPCGLLSDEYFSIVDSYRLGDKVLSCGLHQEGTGAIGRYLHCNQSRVFDGIVHLSFFNCQPSLSARGLLTSISRHCAVPFIGLELEGPWLTADHKRMLEGLVVQAKRNKAATKT